MDIGAKMLFNECALPNGATVRMCIIMVIRIAYCGAQISVVHMIGRSCMVETSEAKFVSS